MNGGSDCRRNAELVRDTVSRLQVVKEDFGRPLGSSYTRNRIFMVLNSQLYEHRYSSGCQQRFEDMSKQYGYSSGHSV